jgi:hypothetical protein
MAILLALALPAAAVTVAAGAAPDAFACSLSNHCHAAAIAGDTTQNIGIAGDIISSCLYQPDDGNFINQEIWDIMTGDDFWNELGLNSGTGLDQGKLVYYPNKTWFWAEMTTTGYYEDNNLGTAATNTSYGIEIWFDGTYWNSIVDGVFSITGKAQTEGFNYGEAGTEYTGGESSGIRDNGEIYDLQRVATNGEYYAWGAASQGALGPGGYITGTYNDAEQSWAGPC